MTNKCVLQHNYVSKMALLCPMYIDFDQYFYGVMYKVKEKYTKQQYHTKFKIRHNMIEITN